jgi:hypothetical protein
MSRSLTSDLQEGYGEVAARLSPGQRLLVERARGRPKVLGGRDRALAEIVAAYRAGPRDLWAPVVLDLVAPALLERLQHFEARPPVLDVEDLSQQLVVQLLHAAATMRVACDGRHLRRELVARARKAVSRRLAREHRHLGWHCPLDDFDEVDE